MLLLLQLATCCSCRGAATTTARTRGQPGYINEMPFTNSICDCSFHFSQLNIREIAAADAGTGGQKTADRQSLGDLLRVSDDKQLTYREKVSGNGQPTQSALRKASHCSCTQRWGQEEGATVQSRDWLGKGRRSGGSGVWG